MTGSQNEYSCFQEGAERLRAAMSGIPDRVPVYAQLHEFAMKELGVPAEEFYTTPEILTNGTLEITKMHWHGKQYCHWLGRHRLDRGHHAAYGLAGEVR